MFGDQKKRWVLRERQSSSKDPDFIKLKAPHPTLVTDCFVLALATTVSFSLSHTANSILQQSSGRQQVTCLSCLLVVLCMYSNSSRMYIGCQLPSAGRHLATTPDPQPRPQWLKPDSAACKLTDRTNMKQALIIDGSSAFREVTQAWNNAAPLQSVGTMSKTFKKRTTDTQVSVTLSTASEPQNDTVLIAEGGKSFSYYWFNLTGIFTGRVWQTLGESGWLS